MIGPFSDPSTVFISSDPKIYSNPSTVSLSIPHVWWAKTASGWIPLDVVTIPE